SVVTADTRLHQIQRDHDPQVVVEADSTADDERTKQPPQPGFHPGGQDVELADKAGGQRNAGQGQHNHRQHGGQAGAAPEQAAVFVERVGIPTLERRRHERHHAEGAQGGQDIGKQIDTHSLHGQAAADDQRDEEIAEVGNRGVAQQSLEVALHQRQQVAKQDGGDGDDSQQVIEPAAVGGRGYLVQPQQHGEYRDL